MQIRNDFPKYILTWKKCVVCSCESMWGGMCSGVSRGEEDRHETSGKNTHLALLLRKNTGAWCRRKTHCTEFYTACFQLKNTQNQEHQFLYAGQEITIYINIKWMLKAKYMINGWFTFLFFLNNNIRKGKWIYKYLSLVNYKLLVWKFSHGTILKKEYIKYVNQKSFLLLYHQN